MRERVVTVVVASGVVIVVGVGVAVAGAGVAEALAPLVPLVPVDVERPALPSETAAASEANNRLARSIDDGDDDPTRPAKSRRGIAMQL